jgi:hypothetical protein
VRGCLLLILAMLALGPPASARPEPRGLEGRLIVGYQGWFGCPGDAPGQTGWVHWFAGPGDLAHLTVDLLPDLSGFDPAELCKTGLTRPDGSPIYLYSAQNPRIAAAHFAWMRDHGIDGAAAQRFVVETIDPTQRARRDRELQNVRAAAEAAGRVFFVTYDISGADPKTVTDDVRRDWRHLTGDLGLTRSGAYLVDHGKPVLELWGFGFSDRPGGPAETLVLISALKHGDDGLTAVTLIGGVPSAWRTLGWDSKPDPAWAAVYRSYDVISPWTVGRFADAAGADRFLSRVATPDLAETRRLGLRYLPVAFPGFSWSNLSRVRGGQAPLNQIPRDCGRFYWRQLHNLIGAHVEAIYGAMFDEVDEGTAILPVARHAAELPAGAAMVTLDEDGCDLAPDAYLRIAGKAAELLRTHAAPPERLDEVLQP